MGKRKTKAKVISAKPVKVATVFDCPLCSHEKTCECKLDRRKTNTGTLECRVCKARFVELRPILSQAYPGRYEMQLNALTAPIDIYTKWIDEVIHPEENEEGGASLSSSSTMPPVKRQKLEKRKKSDSDSEGEDISNERDIEQFIEADEDYED